MPMLRADDARRDQHTALSHRPGSLSRGRDLNRRQILQTLGYGSAAAALGAAGFGAHASARQGATPPPVPPAPPAVPGTPTVREKAAELAFDVDRIFRFVADEVLYDAYPGALRGATGTLWGLAGNSVDQALLLAALLDEALIPYRFALGSLDAAAAEKLFGTTTLDEETTRARAERTLATLPPVAQLPDITVTPEQEAALAELPDQADRLVAAAKAQLADSIQIVSGALDAAGIELPAQTLSLPQREREQHVWIQYADGPVWIDLDPSLPDTAPGEASAAVSDTPHALPDDLFHQVTVRLTAETVSGGVPVRSELALYRANAADLAGVQITAMNARPESFEGLGFGITGLLTGTRQYVPYLLIDEEPIRGKALISFGANTDESLGSALLADEDISSEGETLAQWLEVEILSPDAEPVLIERVIFDRIGFATRATGEIDLTDLPPIELTKIDAESPEVYLPAHHAIVLAVMGGPLPFSYFVQDPATVEDMAGLGLVGSGFHLMRDVLAVEAGAGQGYRYYLDAPNIVAFDLRPLGWNGQDGTVESGLDILHRSLKAIPLLGTTPLANPNLVGGVLNAVAERMAYGDGIPARESATASDPDDVIAVNIGTLFEEAIRQNIDISVITPDQTNDPLGPDAGYSPEAKARMHAVLGAGHIIVVPAKPVSLAGKELTGWWVVDPMTGAAWDMLENGKGPSAGEEAVLTAEDLAAIPRYRRLGCQILAITAIAAAVGILGVIMGGTTGKGLGVSGAVVAYGAGAYGRQKGPGDPFGGRC